MPVSLVPQEHTTTKLVSPVAQLVPQEHTTTKLVVSGVLVAKIAILPNMLQIKVSPVAHIVPMENCTNL